MENKMFCYQCQETAGCTGCTKVGVCGKSPELARLQDLLIYTTKGLSEVTTRLREEGKTIDTTVNHLITINLFSTITNANFDDAVFYARIKETLAIKETLLAKLNNKENLSEAALWNATSDKESMAASAIDSKANIIVKDGKATMYLSTKEMSFGSIKASLQEFYIGSEQEDYKNHGATIIEKDAQGNPTLWAFELPHENEYINVMMNPHVAMMGNMDLAARLKIDYTTLTYVSDKTELEPNTKKDDQQENTNKDQTANKENQINENQSVKTGDQTSIQLFMTLFIISITMIGFILRKKHEA